MQTNGELSRQSPDTTSRGNEILAMSAILYILLFWLSCLLVWSRIRLRYALNRDGVSVLLAMLPTSFYFVATLLANDDFHWNMHLSDVPPSRFEGRFKMVFAAEVMFVAACTLAKLSITMLVRRKAASASSFWRGLGIVVVGVVAVQGLVSCSLVLSQCGSPRNFWATDRRACAKRSSTLLVSNIISSLTDFLVFLLPIPAITSSHFSRRQKAIVIFIFGLGLASIVSGILRAHFLYQAVRQEDYTWAYYPVWWASSLQIYLGMMCALIPLCKTFFSTYLPGLFGCAPAVDAEDYASSPRHSPSHKRSIFSANSNLSDGEEELLHFEKVGMTTSTIASRPGNAGLSEEDREYIKITQQTVVQVSRPGEV